ncbi:hypothetical protein ACHAXM_006699 [Skeletonema potamos]|jgi:hypothetical protein
MITTGGNLRQRRGKQPSGSKNVAMKEESPGSANEAAVAEPAPVDQLRNAQQRLMVSHQRTVELHTAWRAQMFRISLLIVFVTLHQWIRVPISTCIADIKESNEASGSGEISGLTAAKLIVTDSFCELLGVIIASLLSYFLALSKQSPLELDAWPYVASSAFVPPCLGFYFHRKHLGCLGTGIDDLSHTRQFPVVVIYHTIVTFAFWFMKNGIQQCEEHVNLVNESIKDFERMDKKIKQKQQLREKAVKKRQG